MAAKIASRKKAQHDAERYLNDHLAPASRIKTVQAVRSPPEGHAVPATDRDAAGQLARFRFDLACLAECQKQDGPAPPLLRRPSALLGALFGACLARDHPCHEILRLAVLRGRMPEANEVPAETARALGEARVAHTRALALCISEFGSAEMDVYDDVTE
jgi:hypothetical protein